jgi:hypothetical protein
MKPDYHPMPRKEWREFIRGLLIITVCGLGILLSLILLSGKSIAVLIDCIIEIFK